MKLVTEEAENLHILIIDHASLPITKLLKVELKKFNAHIYISPTAPEDLKRFDYIFLINHPSPLSYLKKHPNKKIICVFINNKKKAAEIAAYGLPTVKVIHLNSFFVKPQDIDRIFWFAFSKNKESLLNLELMAQTLPAQKKRGHTFDWHRFISKKRLIVFLISAFFLFHLIIFPFIALSSYFFFKASDDLKNEQISRAKTHAVYGSQFNNTATFLYGLSRPTYLFFSLAIIPDNFIGINTQLQSTFEDAFQTYENSSEIERLIFKKDKSVSEQELLALRINKLNKQVADIETDLKILNQKLPGSYPTLKPLKSELVNDLDLIKKVKTILPYLNTILAYHAERKYLLLFANNMELRPGGGFIGSFGVLTMKDLTFQNMQIYDVYDADGQLTTHIEPPAPLRLYLDQPNWFLRDSAFSPDFLQNYAQAKNFLEKELNMHGFAGGMLITTSTIENLLVPFNDLFLSDFNEHVNHDNFYIKAQLYSEHDFFPGSIQKKSFLGTLARQMVLTADTVSPAKFAYAIKKSLDEKQFVMAFEDTTIQRTIDSLYWSGRTIIPQCPNQNPDCIIDYLLPVDANLGVNKANFFVSRLIKQQVHIGADGVIKNVFSLRIKNDSPNAVFPGGTYKNYFQLFIPAGATIQEVTKNGVLVEQYDQDADILTRIGFLFEVPPQKSVDIQIKYSLGTTILPGNHIYQLVLEKQIGSKNSDFSLNLTLPQNIHLVNQNFSPLVKENQILYNTSLTADKIFLIELQRDK